MPERTPEAYQRQMRLIAEEPLRKGWTPAGLLWELALKEGYGLNSVLDTVDAGGPAVHRVTDPDKDPPQRLLACFDESLPDDLTRRLGLTTDDLLFVRDAALTDTLAANLALQCRLRTI